MINMEYKPGAIAYVLGYEKNLKVIHSHHKPEDVMNLIQKGTFSELTEEFAMHEGCITAFKEFKRSISKCQKQEKYSDSSQKDEDIADIQAATQGISSDTIMMGLLEKKIELLTSKMFEQQDKSSESSEKTEEN